MEPEYRSWGDGATDKRAHVIEDISYAGGYITCRCGATVVGESAADLADRWTSHGGSVLRMWGTTERGQEPTRTANQRRDTARAAIVLLGRQCRCFFTDRIESCPNYMPGDAEGSYDDDDDHE